MRLCRVYSAFEEVRHSLVHRRAEIDASGSLIGTSTAGVQLKAVTVEEQEALLRVVQRVTDCMLRVTVGARGTNALLAELDVLSTWSGEPTTGASRVSQPPTLVEVPVSRGQELDLRAIKQRLRATFQGTVHIDVTFTSGNSRHTAHLEDVPDCAVLFEPGDLLWLT